MHCCTCIVTGSRRNIAEARKRKSRLSSHLIPSSMKIGISRLDESCRCGDGNEIRFGYQLADNSKHGESRWILTE